MELIKSNSKFLSIQPPVMEASKINIKLLFQHKCIIDKKGNSYNIEDNKLIKISLKDFSKNLNNIINKWDDYTIVLNVYSVDDFNKLCTLLKDIPNRENNIIIDISTLDNIQKDDHLNFEDLPEYAHVTTHKLNYPGIDELESPIESNGSRDFSTWILWLDDKDLVDVMNNLLPACKRHVLSERVIGKQLYTKFAANYHLDDDVAVQMFYWCCKNIETDESIDDSINAYRAKKGSSLAKAKLLKILLNNRYTKISCDIEYGYLNGVEHAWNVIRLNDRTYRVDTTNGKSFISKEELLENGYVPYVKNNNDSILKRVIG